MTERVARLSYFFPAHNEEANLRGLVAEALETLPSLADAFEIIIVNDGSRDATGAIADELAAAHPGVVRAVHHPTNLGYGAALRSGFRAARHDLVAFTDGDRQFRVADIGRLIDAPRRGRRARTSSSATGSSAPTRSSGRSTPGCTGSRTGSSSASGSATSTAPASCSGARRSRGSRSSRAARSSRPSS